MNLKLKKQFRGVENNQLEDLAVGNNPLPAEVLRKERLLLEGVAEAEDPRRTLVQ